METWTHPDFVAAVRQETGEVSSLLVLADLAAPVRSCPGWQVRDLVEHLGGVHRWATEIVRTGERSHFPEAPTGEDVRQWFDDGADVLVRTLSDADPERACWTLAPPRIVGFWSRRQAHEAMIHRWDLATAIGGPADLDPALAVDGIDEAVDMFFPRQVALERESPLTDAVALVDPRSDRRWVLDGNGKTTDHASVDVAATVTGDAVPLLLMVWQRVELADSPVQVDGDFEAARRGSARGSHPDVQPFTMS